MTERISRIDNQKIKTTNKSWHKQMELRMTLEWSRKT